MPNWCRDGSTIVPTFNWTDLFAPKVKKITGIKKMYPFRVESASPGCVFTKELETGLLINVIVDAYKLHRHFWIEGLYSYTISSL